MPWLFPHTDARSWFTGDEPAREVSAAAQFIAARGLPNDRSARALGLDCGPMSGFSSDALNAAFFADQPRWRVNFICAIGYGDPASIFGRSPRPDFAAFDRIV